MIHNTAQLEVHHIASIKDIMAYELEQKTINAIKRVALLRDALEEAELQSQALLSQLHSMGRDLDESHMLD